MLIAIGSDHHGVDARRDICRFLARLGHETQEFGPPTSNHEPVDYPDIAAEVASRVSQKTVDRGILICGTGLGMSIVANKFAGVRAASIWDEFVAEWSRRHNDINVLCLSADMMTEVVMNRIITIWLDMPFDGGRHARRVEKIAAIEQELRNVTQTAHD